MILGWSPADLHGHRRDRRGQREPAAAARSSSSPSATRSRWRTRSASASATPGGRKIVCRSGSPIDVDDLAIASLGTARSIVVLAPETDEPDADVIKTILAITNDPDRRPEPYHIVAELRDRANVDVARMVGRDEVELILSEELIARITAQTCRQSGPVGRLHGAARLRRRRDLPDRPARARRDARSARRWSPFEDAAVIGLLPGGGTPQLNPPMDTVIAAGDRLIVIAADDDQIHAAADAPTPIDEARSARRVPARSPPRNGRSCSAGTAGPPRSSRELDAYVADGSEVVVVSAEPGVDGEAASLVARSDGPRAQRIDAAARRSRPTGRPSTRSPSRPSTTSSCSATDRLDPSRADARTLVTLLHLRDIADRLGHDFSIVSEMLDLRNRALAEVTRADDFIVSDRLVSLMLAQVAENKHLNAVFDDLFDPAGSEIYLRPAGDYVALDRAVPFAAVIEAARRRGEIAFGYRVAARSEDASAAYGVSLNPSKRSPLTFTAADRIVVLAEG